MPRLIFDIETVGTDFDSLDDKSREYLLAYADSPEKETEVREGLSFSPLTGEIVAIGILNPDTGKGAVHFQSPGSKLDKTEEKDVQYVPHSGKNPEKEVLEEFWEVIRYYNQFITFNGRGFDCPYLMIRSAIHKIKPPKNLMPYRYGEEHTDLFDRLSFFGAVRRRMNLHLWCRAFDIESPKSKGITGDDVGRLFKEKKFLDIARYCADDLRATRKLFEYWEKYINVA